MPCSTTTGWDMNSAALPAELLPAEQPRLPIGAPVEFVNLVERLSSDADVSRHRLALRLRQVLSRHDLTRQELLAAQRDVVRLSRIGAQPTPTEFWQRTALPRAAILVDESMNAIVEEGAALGQSVDEFLAGLAGPSLTDWADRSLDGAQLLAATEVPINRLIEAVPPPQSIDGLGRWWQRRLRWTARRQSLPELVARLLSASGPEARTVGREIVDQTELSVLDGPPWCHGDRLLSAFELAHAEIKTQTELVAEGLTTKVATRGRRFLSPRQRVTIELRN
jgi:hypothetical protein